MAGLGPEEDGLTLVEGASGLKSAGATDFFNVVLQVLAASPEALRAVMAFRYHESVHGPAEHCINYQLQVLLAQMTRGSKAVVDPDAMMSAMGWDRTARCMQQDACEFFRLLLDTISRAQASEEAKTGDKEEKEDDSTAASGEDDDSALPSVAKTLEKVFEIEALYSITSEECGHTKCRSDRAVDLTVPVKSFAGLKESMDATCHCSETLSGSNAYHCSTCDEKKTALKEEHLLASLPKVLAVQLRRIEFSFETFESVKVSDQFAVPQTIDIGTYVAKAGAATEADTKGCEYSLFGIVTHVGSSVGYGCYTCYVQLPATSEWVYICDSRIEVLSNDDVATMFELIAAGDFGTDSHREGILRHAHTISTGAIMCLYRPSHVDAYRLSDAVVLPEYVKVE